MSKRPQNCGTGYCSCIECIYGKDGCVADEEQCNDGCLAQESVMRIEADRIWVDPDVQVTEAAALVLQLLEENIKRLVLAEREACAEVCDRFAENEAGFVAEDCAAAIRARGEK